MENFRIILTQQKAALLKDLEEYNAGILALEEQLEAVKDQKTKANSQLRSITKKLEKL